MHSNPSTSDLPDPAGLVHNMRAWARELGFADLGVAGIDLSEAEQGLLDWLAAGFHGSMDYMARHGLKRARPAELLPGTVSVLSARMNYWPEADLSEARALQAAPERAAISRYALGRDYHKLLRSRLQKLAERIAAEVGEYGYRVFVDSAPVLEVELATRAGLGWRGKHTLLLNREAGSLFFLGEIFVDLVLPADAPAGGHCGRCTACLPACPTQAIVAPYRLDARRCISYLTIEHAGSIPEDLRPLIGNRVYGCDDCQLACPWNRFAQPAQEADFSVRNGLDRATLVELFAWSETEFKERLAGSPIYRIGHERWLRNLAVGLGNAPTSAQVLAALRARGGEASELVREHVAWALARHAAAMENRNSGAGAAGEALKFASSHPFPLMKMAFADNLKQIPGVSHLAAIELLDAEGAQVALIEHKPGQIGSLAVYNHLAQFYGAITPEAASKGLELYAEHTEDARAHPGKHPNIDRLLQIVLDGCGLRVKHVFAGSADQIGD